MTAPQSAHLMTLEQLREAAAGEDPDGVVVIDWTGAMSIRPADTDITQFQGLNADPRYVARVSGVRLLVSTFGEDRALAQINYLQQ